MTESKDIEMRKLKEKRIHTSLGENFSRVQVVKQFTKKARTQPAIILVA